MNKNYILIVLAFCFLAIVGPKIGEKVTQDRMLREQEIIIKKLVYAQDVERERLKKTNRAFVEVIKNYQDEEKKK